MDQAYGYPDKDEFSYAFRQTWAYRCKIKEIAMALLFFDDGRRPAAIAEACWPKEAHYATAAAQDAVSDEQQCGPAHGHDEAEKADRLDLGVGDEKRQQRRPNDRTDYAEDDGRQRPAAVLARQHRFGEKADESDEAGRIRGIGASIA